MTRSFVARLAFIVLTLFSSCVGHNAADDMKRPTGPQARLGTLVPSYVARYEVSLIEVQRSEATQSRFGPIKIAPATKGLFVAEDDLIRITWAGPDDQIGFDLLNKTDSPAKILWEDAAYVDISGQSRRVIHSGVTLLYRNSPQTPSVVPSKGRLNDIVYPSDHVSYYGNWSQRPMFPCLREGSPCTEQDRKLVAAHSGLDYRVLLPLEVGQEKHPYIFVFKVNKAGVVTVTK